MAPSRYPDRWRSENFSTSEIDQLIRVARDLASGVLRFDARRLSSRVRKWLVKWNYAESAKNGFIPTDLLSTQYGDSWLPIEALWRIVKPMLNADGYAGYSIRRNRGWMALNLFCSDQHSFTDRDERVMFDTLLLLASHGYIWFQSSGSVWEISERTDRREVA